MSGEFVRGWSPPGSSNHQEQGQGVGEKANRERNKEQAKKPIVSGEFVRGWDPGRHRRDMAKAKL
jgi:hypothetical protein